jgi:outer membrane protein assembly factor BamB
VVQTRHTLHGVALDDGRELWSQDVPNFRGMNILTPIVVGESSIFTATYGGRAQLLDVTERDDVYTVGSRWNEGLQGYMTSPVVIDGHAYFLTRSNRFACVRLEDGEQRWVSGPTGDDYWSLVARGDRILSLSDSGRLRIIRANPEAYEVVSDAEVSEDKTWAHVAVAGRDIVIREQEGLALFRWE